MKDILAACNLSAVRQFTAERVLLAFDYDGTLAPIVDDPRRAYMRPPTRSLLSRVSRLYQCAVITGRGREAAERFVQGANVKWIVGNHGLEWPAPRKEDLRYKKLVREWKRALAKSLKGLEGVVLEDKRLSLTVHVRHARNSKEAQRKVEEAAAQLPGCRSEPGLEVINLLPRGAPDKGYALMRLLGLSGCTHAIYLGDDVTDEAVFALKREPVLSVSVGAHRRSRAKYFLANQRRVDAFLRLLYSIRFEGAVSRPARGRSARPAVRGVR